MRVREVVVPGRSRIASDGPRQICNPDKLKSSLGRPSPIAHAYRDHTASVEAAGKTHLLFSPPSRYKHGGLVNCSKIWEAVFLHAIPTRCWRTHVVLVRRQKNSTWLTSRWAKRAGPDRLAAARQRLVLGGGNLCGLEEEWCRWRHEEKHRILLRDFVLDWIERGISEGGGFQG